MAATLPPPGFTREVTPTWLAATTLLAGQRPPDVTALERFVHLGCGHGETAAVVAANHPNTEVWAWDPHPGSLEATRRLAAEAGLANLRVHEHRDLPPDLGGGPADVIVVQDLPASVDDAVRHRLGAAIGASLRPGGLLCIMYPTLAAWSEIAPVQALMRRLALGHRGSGHELVPAVLETIDRLRAGGARYLTARPAVAEWLAGLATLPPAEVEARYLAGPFRPMSPAQVATTLAPASCELIGSARPTDDLDLDLPPELAAEVRGAVTRIVQETYRDLATRRSYRRDLFRLGGAPLDERERIEGVADLGLAGLAAPQDPAPADVDRDAWEKLTTLGVTAAELGEDPAQVARAVAVLMDGGQAHPVVANGPRRSAVEACEALNAAFAARPASAPDLRAMAPLGSAVPISQSRVPAVPAPGKAR